jgi:hypothetical protein
MMESDVVMVIWPGVMPGDQIPHTTITLSGDGYRTTQPASWLSIGS